MYLGIENSGKIGNKNIILIRPLKKDLCLIVCMYLNVGMCMCAHIGQRRQAPLELQLWAVVSCMVWVLGTGFGSSVIAYTFLTAETSLQLLLLRFS